MTQVLTGWDDHKGARCHNRACAAIFPGLKVSDVMDLVRVHGYGVIDLTPLKAFRRNQGQALMEKIRIKVAGKRAANQVSKSHINADLIAYDHHCIATLLNIMCGESPSKQPSTHHVHSCLKTQSALQQVFVIVTMKGIIY